MLGVVIAMFAGGFIGLLIGVWLVADNVRHNRDRACLACGRPWHHEVAPSTHVHLIERAPNVRVLPPTEGDNQ